MKNYLLQLKIWAAAVFVTFGFHSCVKDTCTKTYTIYTPVYKTSAEVRANIKSSLPVAIKNPGKLFIKGSYIFLNEVDRGIHVIDNANPSAPVNKYFIAIPGNIDLAVNGNTLYADLYTDLVSLDITDPANVQVKKITDNIFIQRVYTGNFVADRTKIIVDWVAKDTTVTANCNYTMSNKRSDAMVFQSGSALLSSFAAPVAMGGSMARFTLLNDHLYTVTDNALNVFNVSQAQQPVFVGKIALGWGIETIYPFKNTLFIGSNTGMLIYGTANPAQPNRISTFTHVRSCDPVIADNDYAYVTLRSGTVCNGFTNQLDVINVQNLSSPFLLKTYSLTNPHGLSKDGDILLVCDGNAGLKMFDASTVTSLKLLKTIGGMDTYDVIATNGIAIVVAKDGLYQYDYSNKSDLKFLSKVALQTN